MRLVRSLGPAVAPTSPSEAFRAGLGAFIGLGLTGLIGLWSTIDQTVLLYLVAPFGATSVLLFAVPNSPLAQPWSAVVGNTLAALVAITVCVFLTDPVARIAISVGLAIAATILCRAIHPPAGAVAMVVAMSPEEISRVGYWFALSPIALGTACLVLIAAGYARLTGRRYPFRQFDESNQNGTRDADPFERLGLSEDELTRILERYRQSFNLGTEDLARLIGAAELQVAAHRTGPLTAADIMSRDLISVSPQTPLTEVADIFRRHRFSCLPVVTADGNFRGMIFQLHLITRARENAIRFHTGFGAALRQMFERDKTKMLEAQDIMSLKFPRVFAETPIAILLPALAMGDMDAVPVIDDRVIDDQKIVGVVTRTDLIAALARSLVQDG